MPAPIEAEPALPEKLGVGKNDGFFQPGALLQFWGVLDSGACLGFRAAQCPAGEPDDSTATTFRLRRLELRAKGEVAPSLVAYSAMIDVAKLISFQSTNIPVTSDDPDESGSVSVLQPSGDTSVLQDFFITFMSDYADVSVGQYKIPISLEGYGAASKIIFPERSRVARVFGDRRDIGIRVDKKLGRHFYYHAGVFNGTGQNRLDSDNEKDLALRLELYPIDGLTVAAAGYATAGKRDGAIRDRLEGDIRYEAGGVLVQGEYIHGWDGANEDNHVESHGAYGVLGYTFLERVQPAVRVGFVDGIDTAAKDKLTFVEGCVNYYLRGQEARLALSVSSFNPEGDGKTLTEGILFAQVSY